MQLWEDPLQTITNDDLLPWPNSKGATLRRWTSRCDSWWEFPSPHGLTDKASPCEGGHPGAIPGEGNPLPWPKSEGVTLRT